jgi:hypothetical protein
MANKKGRRAAKTVAVSEPTARAGEINLTSTVAAVQSITTNAGSEDGAVQIVRSTYWERITAAVLLVIVAVPSFVIFQVVWSEWHNSPAQRGWLILGFGFYIASAMKALGNLLIQVLQHMLYLRVELHSSRLFDAVSDVLAKEAEKRA